MRDWMFFGLAALAAASAIALALVWPAGDAGQRPVPAPTALATTQAR